MRKNSIKNTRINMEVQRELSEIIRGGIKDPRIHPMTSVIAVEVTPDLKYCKAYISVLGNEDAGKATIEGLKSAEGYVRRELARRVNPVSYTHLDVYKRQPSTPPAAWAWMTARGASPQGLTRTWSCLLYTSPSTGSSTRTAPSAGST